MQYRVEELAAACGIKVFTVRFYQGRGLIPAPARRGRAAIYGPAHLVRIRQIRSLLEQGFSLAQIQLLPAPDEESGEFLVILPRFVRVMLKRWWRRWQLPVKRKNPLTDQQSSFVFRAMLMGASI